MQRLTASPCSLPKWELDPLLNAYAELGFRKYEVFTSWCKSAFDPASSPQIYLEKARQYGMRYTSLHLPPVNADEPATIDQAIQAARFASELGVKVVLFKAVSRPSFIACAPPFLDAIEGLGLYPVLQNHFGTPLTTLEDLREVMDTIADPRLKLLLEVGHLAKAGTHWKEPCDLYGDRIELVHVKDMANGVPVPFGTGEIDFDGLFACLDDLHYSGDIVVEIETNVEEQDRLKQMKEACDFLYNHGLNE